MSLYRLLLLAFPRRVRRDFGEDMERLFEAQRRAVRESRDGAGRFWISVVLDAFVHGTAERISIAGESLRAFWLRLRNWRVLMAAFAHDLKHAVRLLVRQPGVTIVAMVTLALGIGANAAIFSAVDAILLRPLPYEEPDRLVMVWEKRQAEGVLDNLVAAADYLDWARMNTVFDSIAAFGQTTRDLTGSGDPVRLGTGAVTPAFFDVFRIKMQLGRTFDAGEGIQGRNRVVILSHGAWQRRFGSDPAIVGRTIMLNGFSYEIVGVLPVTFEFPDPTLEIWTTLAFEGTPEPPSRDTHNYFVYGRLKPGVSLQQARVEMDRLGNQLSIQYPETNRTHGIWVTNLRDQIAGPMQRSAAQASGLRSGLLLLLAAVAFVLLIACVNVANLLLARAAGRRREMAVRAAIGAGRSRLAAQALTESLVLGLAGGIAGLLVGYWGIVALREFAPKGAQIVGLEHLALDGRVLAFAFLLSIVTGLVFGLLPAFQLAKQDVNLALKDGGRTAGSIRRRLRLALVVSEIALASLLLVGAGLTLRSFQTLLRAQPGFTSDGVLTSVVALPISRYRNNETLVTAVEQIEGRFAAIPGVRAVGATSLLPLSGQDSRRGVVVEGRVAPPDTPTRAHPRSVTPGYFRAMGIQLVSGRFFTDADRATAPPVAIVNETMARSYWPGKSPVGSRVRYTGTQEIREVVGVIRDVRHWGLDAQVNPEMYVPYPQLPISGVTFAVAAQSGVPASLSSAIREELRAFDPNLPLSNVRTMSDVAARSVGGRRAAMVLLAVFGVFALVLAAAGIYGVMSHLVALRTSEIGVRVTLGARPLELMRLILQEGLVQTAIGLAIGLGASVLVMRGFQTMLYEVNPADPFTLITVAVVLMITAAVACAIPARRAMRVDPVQALRH
jgi:putative ABC transport system permease protein